jgi:hypothetical protein
MYFGKHKQLFLLTFSSFKNLLKVLKLPKPPLTISIYQAEILIKFLK